MADHNVAIVSECAGITLLVYADDEPTDDELDALLADASALPSTRIMVVLGAMRITVAQRRRVASCVNAKGYKAANLVSSTFTRGLVTAVAWLTSNERLAAFEMDEIETAAHWLEVDPTHHAELVRVIAAQRAELQARRRNPAPSLLKRRSLR